MKRILWICAAALVLFLGIGIYDAGKNEVAPPPANTQIVFKRGLADGHRLRFKSWSARYDRIVSNADQTILDLDGIRDGVIYKKGKPYLHVRAAHMTVNTLTRDFTARGPFHVESVGSKPRRSFDTDDATWNDAAQTMTFARRIVIHSGNDDPLAVGSLTLNVRSGNIALRDVTGPVRWK